MVKRWHVMHKKWIVYRIEYEQDPNRVDVRLGTRVYYTRRGSPLSATDLENWSYRVGQAHVFECSESEMKDFVRRDVYRRLGYQYREIGDMELFIERLRG